MEGREAHLLVLPAHQSVECCIHQSQQTRKLDRSSYGLSLVQRTTSVPSELR